MTLTHAGETQSCNLLSCVIVNFANCSFLCCMEFKLDCKGLNVRISDFALGYVIVASCSCREWTIFVGIAGYRLNDNKRERH